MYEGTPDTPTRDRWWQIVERYKVNILYTAPTTIRTFMKWGEDLPAQHDLSSLRLLGSVGEPINPEAWIWYRDSHRRRALPHRRHVVADRDRRHPHLAAAGDHGHQAGRRHDALPRRLRRRHRQRRQLRRQRRGGLSGAHRAVAGHAARHLRATTSATSETYWSRFPGRYFAGDGAKRDEDGDLWLLGRVDDVMNISGHRISTTEVEHALVSHPAVAEAAVVGGP